jgi:hypothetical protein
MTEHTLAPIELTDDELLAVSGGGIHIAVGISQRNYQSASLAQVGGNLSIGGGGNGATSVTGNTTFTETFNASITQSATNSNTGSVTATVSASSS